MAIGSLRHQHPKGKFTMFSFRVVCRSVSNHLFLLAVLLFLICLHRYFPFLFSLLVSASPVLICTAVVLGTLLIHGKPNNNDLKYTEESSDTGATLRTGVEEYHPYSGNKEGIYSKDRFAEVRNGIVERGMRASGTLGSGIRLGGNVTKEADWEYCNVELSKGSKIHEEKSKSDLDFADFEKANVQMCMDRDYDRTFKVDQVVGMQDKYKSCFGQPKADNTGNHEYETNNHEPSDGESDEVEKSSFDALVADAIPTAQETHPLLDSEDPRHPDASHNAPLPELESLDSNQSSENSGEDEHYDVVNVDVDDNLKGKDDGGKLANAWMERENQHLERLITGPNDERDDGEEDVDDDESIEDVDDDDDDDDDDEEQENKILETDARNNQVTLWTEEDEKNLRLVGNSELERDLRLENLLARRRAKRNFSMISERNLIDLDRPLPFHVTPISTTRANPFETPVDTKQQHCNIPPIPGSAPPVRVAGKNPFDSPSTSPKGNQNLTEDQIHREEPSETNLNNAVFHEDGSSSTGYNSTGNMFKPEFVETNRKDAVFRRYESFSTGYNIIEETSGHDFMETDRRDAVLRRHDTFNTRSEFRSSLYSPEKLANLKMRPFFVPEHVIEDQEVRRSSSSHESESSASSSESDQTESLSILANDEDVGPSKDATIEGDQSNHGPSHSKDTSSESSDAEDSLHDDTGEEFAASLEVNAEVYADHIYQNASATHDNASSNTSVSSEDDHSSGKKDEVEDETVSEPGVSPKASSNGTIEPPVYDASPSGTEKTTPFSSTHSEV